VYRPSYLISHAVIEQAASDGQAIAIKSVREFPPFPFLFNGYPCSALFDLPVDYPVTLADCIDDRLSYNNLPEHHVIAVQVRL